MATNAGQPIRAVVLKPLPVTVIAVPGAPETGEIELMVGAGIGGYAETAFVHITPAAAAMIFSS